MGSHPALPRPKVLQDVGQLAADLLPEQGKEPLCEIASAKDQPERWLIAACHELERLEFDTLDAFGSAMNTELQLIERPRDFEQLLDPELKLAAGLVAIDRWSPPHYRVGTRAEEQGQDEKSRPEEPRIQHDV